jgi:hypothetical protein
MVIDYIDILDTLCSKATNKTITDKEFKQLKKLNEWIHNDSDIE